MQSSTPPGYAGWFPVGNLLATGASYLSSTLWSSSTPENSIVIPGLEKKVDFFCFIICIALRGFLGSGYKPTLQHYHITWDPPEEVNLGKAVKIPKQGCDRWQKGENASRDIIDDWDGFTDKALDWFKLLIASSPHEDVPTLPSLNGDNSRCISEWMTFIKADLGKNQEAELQQDEPRAVLLSEDTVCRLLLEVDKKLKREADKKKRFQISEIFKLAIRGFEATKEPYLQEQHLPKTQQLIQKLERCKKKIDDALQAAPNALDRAAFHAPGLQAGGDSFLAEKLKNSWDEKTIDYIYNHFQELQKLHSKMRSPLEQQAFTDHINCIEAKVSCKCTEFAMIHESTRTF